MPYCLPVEDLDTRPAWQREIAQRAWTRVIMGAEPDDAITGAVESARRAGYPIPPKPGPPVPGETRIERIKRTVSVVDVASSATRLRRAGRGRLKGLCPIHPERTPSFCVWSEEGRWWCFGACSRGGDVIDLYQELHRRMPDE